MFEKLEQVIILKRLLDALEKNPRRTIGALAVVFLTGAGVHVSFNKPCPPPRLLSEIPSTTSTKPSFFPDGTLERLPVPKGAEAILSHTLTQNERRHQAVLEELRSRSDDAEITEREIELLNEAGKVKY